MYRNTNQEGVDSSYFKEHKTTSKINALNIHKLTSSSSSSL